MPAFLVVLAIPLIDEVLAPAARFIHAGPSLDLDLTIAIRDPRWAMSEPEAKFLKSGLNRRKENRALELLLKDRRIQHLDNPTKALLLDLLPVKGEFGIQTFDAVMTPSPRPPITAESLGEVHEGLVLSR